MPKKLNYLIPAEPKDQDKEKKYSNGKGKGNPKQRSGGNRNSNRNNDWKKDGKKQDPFWYAKDAETIKDFANLPFVNVSDAPITDYNISGNPAFMIVPFNPIVPGTWFAPGSGQTYATKAANAYYQSIAQGFSANFDFEAPDLMFTAIAGADLHAFMVEVPRALGYIGKYFQDNNSWSRVIIEALGFDYDDMRQRRKDWVSEYNIRAGQINDQIAVPKDFFIGDRWCYLSSNLFCESTPINYTVTFGYKHNSVLKYDGLSRPTGTSLTYQAVTPAKMKLEDWTFLVDHLIQAITGTDTMQMFGAIRRVYGNDQLQKIATIDSSISNEVVHNEIQSLQLHNADFVMSFYSPITTENLVDGFAAYQTADGQIVAEYYASFVKDDTLSDKQFIDYNSRILSLCGTDDTSAAAVLDITANMLPISDYSDREFYLDAQKIYPRTEVLLSPRFHVHDTEQVFVQWIHEDKPIKYQYPTPGMYLAARMDRSPYTMVFRTEQDAEERMVARVIPSQIIHELDKFTVVTCDYLKRTNTKCAYNLLALPAASAKITK